MSDAPSLDALARLAAAAQAMLDAAALTAPLEYNGTSVIDWHYGQSTYTVEWVGGLGLYADRNDPATLARRDDIGRLLAAAPDLARGLVAAVDALRAEREARAQAEAEREAYRADAHRLAAANGRLVDEADAAQRGRRAAEAQRDALAAAVREERRLKALHRAALHEEISAAILDTDSDRENAAMAESRETAEAAENATARLDALLSGAPADVVRAGVVRDFLRAHDRVPWAVFCDGPQLEREAEARAALDAALAAVKETP